MMQRTVRMYPPAINTPYQYTLSTNPINISYQHLIKISCHPLNPPSQRAFSIHHHCYCLLGQNVDVYQARKMLDSKTTQQTEQGTEHLQHPFNTTPNTSFQYTV